MIQFTNPDYPNFHLNIHNNTITIIVTLNITEKMKSFLSTNLVFSSKKRLVYVLKKTILISDSSEQIILAVANDLINTAMINCRTAKQCALDVEIENIKKQSARIQFAEF